MLTRLLIQDVVLIDRLSVPFDAGLNVLTGETGAGKSILLDSLSLALGARSDSGLIRTDAPQACVTAEFSGPSPLALAALLDEQGLAAEDPLILRRTVSRDGKSRAFLCDQPIGITLLRKIGEHLLEVHGQHETHGLLDPATHRGLLDAFAGENKLRQETAQSFTSWREAQAAYAEVRALCDRAQAEEEFLRAAVQEIDDLSPEANEIETLSEKRTQLQHREKIVDALQTTESALSGHRGAAASLATAGKTLARIADKAPNLGDILAIVDRASNEVAEATHQLTRYAHDIDSDAQSLDKIEERLFKLRAVARKHGVGAEGLHALHADLRRRLALLTGQDDRETELSKAVAKNRAQYIKHAENLRSARLKASTAIAKGIMRELPALKLERAVFTVDCAKVEEPQWGPDGMDRVTFLASTNPGAPPSPLHKVASGGELARFMLAIKVVLAKADPVPTLVFDEVDSGIGGATASAVGQRLAHLGRDVQVLVVTHSPQVAARGAQHLRVEKHIKAGQATTTVAALAQDERIEEIARMLSGAAITPAARDAAKALFQDNIA